jgi:Ca-activated chloride channel family protein
MPKSYLLFIITFGFLGLAAGQSGAASVEGPKVNVAFFASDEHGKPVSDIASSDLVALDNRRPPIRILGVKGRTQIPLLLGILIDTSGSQKNTPVYKATVQAASEFVGRVLHDGDDRAFFEQFAVATEATQLMNRRDFLGLKIDLKPYGVTKLYDALSLACDERMKADPSRDFLRVIVLVSDGEDNYSHNSFKQAVKSAQRAGVVIFALDTGRFFAGGYLPPSAISASLPPRTGPIILQDLSDETGGVAFLDLESKDASRAFAAIEEQIDNMHLLSYVPADTNPRTQHHSLKINPIHAKDKLRLRAPKGYYSSLSAQ